MNKARLALTLGAAALAAGCASFEAAPPGTTAMSGPPAPVPSQVGCDHAVFQQALLQRLNAARSSPQVCADTKLPAAAPVRWHPALAAAAGAHAKDLARRDLFGHRGSDGSLVEQRMRRQGYIPTAAGESIAGGDFNPNSLVNTWLGNERHCRTLMNPAYTEVGASCANRDDSDFGTYWTMVLGNRSEPVRRVTAPAAKKSRAVPKRKATAKPAARARPAAKARPPAVR
jgi:uncharacterized protein YkwD